MFLSYKIFLNDVFSIRKILKSRDIQCHVTWVAMTTGSPKNVTLILIL